MITINHFRKTKDFRAGEHFNESLNNQNIFKMTSPGLRRVNSLALHLPEKTAPGELFHIIKTVMNDDDVKCVQHLSDAKWIVTCASTLARDKLYGATLKINEKQITATAADGSTAFVNVFFAPQELSDPAIITKLSQYGRVMGCRRGHWQTQPGWENGIRHLRMEIKTAIPSFVRVGPHQLMIKYEGQQPTCRTCGEPGHLAVGCPSTTCYNCGEAGHRSVECQKPRRCRICNQSGHVAKDCPDSWRNTTKRHASEDHQASTPAATTTNASSAAPSKTPPRPVPKTDTTSSTTTGATSTPTTTSSTARKTTLQQQKPDKTSAQWWPNLSDTSSDEEGHTTSYPPPPTSEQKTPDIAHTSFSWSELCKADPRSRKFFLLEDELEADHTSETSSNESTISLASVSSKRVMSESSSSPAGHADQRDEGFKLQRPKKKSRKLKKGKITNGQ